MLKLVTVTPRDRAASAMKAAMALESMPPDRKTPSGTSDIIWRSTAVASASRTARAASSSVHARTGVSATSQYRSTRTVPSR